MPVMTNETNKGFNFGVSVGRWTLSNGLEIFLGGADPSLSHMVGKIVDLSSENFAFGRLQFEAMFSNLIKDHSHPYQMFFFGLREDYHII